MLKTETDEKMEVPEAKSDWWGRGCLQGFHTNYYNGFRDVKEEDANHITPEGHPVLANSPKTKKDQLSES